MYKAIVITVSDSLYFGKIADESGKRIIGILKEHGYETGEMLTSPKEAALIRAALTEAVDKMGAALVVTTGGTNCSPRDITPEATRAVCEKLTPGIPEAMRAAIAKTNPAGMLSRAEAGIRGRALILNVPGNPDAAADHLNAVVDVLSPALHALRESASEYDRK